MSPEELTIQHRANALECEQALEKSIITTAKALYGPRNKHVQFSVVVVADLHAASNTTVYQSKVLGFKDNQPTAWELLVESSEKHERAVLALEDLLSSVRYDLGQAIGVSVGQVYTAKK